MLKKLMVLSLFLMTLGLVQAQAQQAKIEVGPCLSTSSEEDTDPLFVVDGEIVKEDNIKKVSPQEIEKVTILKGVEATARYGLKAEGGVIIITTKGYAKEEQEASVVQEPAN